MAKKETEERGFFGRWVDGFKAAFSPEVLPGLIVGGAVVAVSSKIGNVAVGKVSGMIQDKNTAPSPKKSIRSA